MGSLFDFPKTELQFGKWTCSWLSHGYAVYVQSIFGSIKCNIVWKVKLKVLFLKTVSQVTFNK